MELIGYSEHNYCVLIDGQDEAETDHIEQTLVLIQNVLHQAGTKCKICIACRPTASLKMLHNVSSMAIQDYTAANISMYANDRLRNSLGAKNHRDKPGYEEKIDCIVSAVCDRSEGVWVWQSMFSSLSHAVSPSSMT